MYRERQTYCQSRCWRGRV